MMSSKDSSNACMYVVMYFYTSCQHVLLPNYHLIDQLISAITKSRIVGRLVEQLVVGVGVAELREWGSGQPVAAGLFPAAAAAAAVRGVVVLLVAGGGARARRSARKIGAKGNILFC